MTTNDKLKRINKFKKDEEAAATEYISKVSEDRLTELSLEFDEEFRHELRNYINTFYANINRAYFHEITSGGKYIYETYAIGAKTIKVLKEGFKELIESIKYVDSPISVRKYPKVEQNELGYFTCSIRMVFLDPTGEARKDGLFKYLDSF